MGHFGCQKRAQKTDTETGLWFQLYTTSQALGLFFAWEKGYLDVQHDATETFTLAIYTIKQWNHYHSELAFKFFTLSFEKTQIAVLKFTKATKFEKIFHLKFDTTQ